MNPFNNYALLQVMLFYFALSFIVFPLFAYYTISPTATSLGNGWVIGSIISIILWYTMGQQLV